MITADEARKRSNVIRERLDADRREKILKTLDSMIIEAADKGDTQVKINLGYHDTNYIKNKVIEAGYKVAGQHDGIIVIWGDKDDE